MVYSREPKLVTTTYLIHFLKRQFRFIGLKVHGEEPLGSFDSSEGEEGFSVG
jgi:hypothetical protein